MAASKNAKNRKKSTAEAVAKHLQEVIDDVARNTATKPPAVDIEVVELSDDEETPDSREDSVLHEFLKLEADHEERQVSRRFLTDF